MPARSVPGRDNRCSNDTWERAVVGLAFISCRGNPLQLVLQQLELLMRFVHWLIEFRAFSPVGINICFVYQIIRFINKDPNATMPAQPAITITTNTTTSIIPLNHAPRTLVPRSTSPGRAGIATHRTKRIENTTAGTANSTAN